MEREPAHLAGWMGSELSRSDLVVSNDGAILCFPKKITEAQVESLLRSYLDLYVLCPKCKSGPTLLTKVPSLRKTLMACVNCGDLGAMPPILKGYRATAKGERRRERHK